MTSTVWRAIAVIFRSLRLRTPVRYLPFVWVAWCAPPPRRRAGQDWARFGPPTVIVTCCRPSARRNPGCARCAARDVAPASDWGFSRPGPWQWCWSWRACHLGEGAGCPGVRAALGAIGWLAVPWQDPAGADSLGERGGIQATPRGLPGAVQGLRPG